MQGGHGHAILRPYVTNIILDVHSNSYVIHETHSHSHFTRQTLSYLHANMPRKLLVLTASIQCNASMQWLGILTAHLQCNANGLVHVLPNYTL